MSSLDDSVFGRPLLAARLKPNVSRRYLGAADSFLRWVEFNCLVHALLSTDDLDEALVGFIHFSWAEKEGRGRQAAVNAVYGVIMLKPRLREKLVLAKLAVTGWKKLCTVVSFPPLGRRSEDLVFPGSAGSLSRDFRDELLSLGLYSQGYVFHSLRHGGAALASLRRELFLEIMHRLRHKDPKNTFTYLQTCKALLGANCSPPFVLALARVTGPKISSYMLFSIMGD
eukprot:g65347.t1